MSDGTPISEYNLIDVFGYMIPGILLLAGIVIPVDINLEFLNLVGLTIIGLFAFVIGMALSRIDGQSWFVSDQPDHVFARDLFQAQKQSPINSERDINYTSSEYFDYEVWKLCKNKFSLPENFSETGYYVLWLATLSYLETTPYVRTFRMQALYTFSSNILVVFEILSVYYVLLVALKGLDQVGRIVIEAGFPLTLVHSLPFLIGLLLISVISTYLFARQSIFFLSRWHLYSKMELYMDQEMND